MGHFSSSRRPTTKMVARSRILSHPPTSADQDFPILVRPCIRNLPGIAPYNGVVTPCSMPPDSAGCNRRQLRNDQPLPRTQKRQSTSTRRPTHISLTSV